MAEKRVRLSMMQLVIAVGIVSIMGGLLAFAHATSRLREAEEQATLQAGEVQLATRVFVDWLMVDAVDRKLDAMTLRRVALLEHARAARLRGLALLSMLIGAVLLLLANAARILREGVVRMPDSTWAQDVSSENSRQQSRRKAARGVQKIRAGSARQRLELLRHPAS